MAPCPTPESTAAVPGHRCAMTTQRRSATAVRRFERHLVLAHLRQVHPSCPEDVRRELATRVAMRIWSDPIRLGKAVGIATSTYARHKFTDYDLLLEQGVARSDAREQVAPTVKRILSSWRIPFT